MADLKISQLPAGSVPTGTNIFPVVQSGVTNQVTIAQLWTAPTLTGHPTIEGVTSTGATGTGNMVYATSPSVASPTITGHATIEGVTATGATGTGAFVFGTSPTISSPTISGHATIEGVTATGATGTGAFVFATSPTLVTPALGTPTSGNFSTGTFTWPTFNQNTSGTAAGLSATLAVASGGTNNTAFTAKSGNVAGLVFFDGTKLANDTTVTDVGYDTSTNTVSAKNLSVSNVLTAGTVTYGSLSGITAAVGMVIQISSAKDALAWGATIDGAGSGSTTYLAWYNGTHWTVMGS